MTWMTMHQLRDRMIHYLIFTVPIVGLILTILELCYFMWWHGDHSTGALIYSFIPVAMVLLLSIPGWFWKNEAEKHDKTKK